MERPQTGKSDTSLGHSRCVVEQVVTEVVVVVWWLSDDIERVSLKKNRPTTIHSHCYNPCRNPCTLLQQTWIPTLQGVSHHKQRYDIGCRAIQGCPTEAIRG